MLPIIYERTTSKPSVSPLLTSLLSNLFTTARYADLAIPRYGYGTYDGHDYPTRAHDYAYGRKRKRHSPSSKWISRMKKNLELLPRVGEQSHKMSLYQTVGDRCLAYMRLIVNVFKAIDSASSELKLDSTQSQMVLKAIWSELGSALGDRELRALLEVNDGTFDGLIDGANGQISGRTGGAAPADDMIAEEAVHNLLSTLFASEDVKQLDQVCARWESKLYTSSRGDQITELWNRILKKTEKRRKGLSHVVRKIVGSHQTKGKVKSANKKLEEVLMSFAEAYKAAAARNLGLVLALQSLWKKLDKMQPNAAAFTSAKIPPSVVRVFKATFFTTLGRAVHEKHALQAWEELAGRSDNLTKACKPLNEQEQLSYFWFRLVDNAGKFRRMYRPAKLSMVGTERQDRYVRSSIPEIAWGWALKPGTAMYYIPTVAGGGKWEDAERLQPAPTDDDEPYPVKLYSTTQSYGRSALLRLGDTDINPTAISKTGDDADDEEEFEAESISRPENSYASRSGR